MFSIIDFKKFKIKNPISGRPSWLSDRGTTKWNHFYVSVFEELQKNLMGHGMVLNIYGKVDGNDSQNKILQYKFSRKILLHASKMYRLISVFLIKYSNYSNYS